MTITVTDLMTAASSMLSGPGEALLRSSASRSYYAAFHRAKQWESGLPARGASSNKQGIGKHAELIHRLLHPDGQCNGTQRQRSVALGAMLQTMRSIRNLSDYELHKTLKRLEAQTQEASALRFIAECNQP